MKKYFLAILGVMLLSSSALAAGYGDAGCGLGSLIFGDTQNVMGQTSAATTNQTLLNQASAISSGTSNCDSTEGIVLAERKQEIFVTQNFSSLAKEMATGHGEHLGSIAELLGCSAMKQARFNALAQRNYATIFVSDSTTPAHVLSAMKNLVMHDAELSTACTQ